MAARSRTRSGPARGWQRLPFPTSPLIRAEVIGALLLAAVVAAVLWIADVGAIVSGVRTWLLETFGLGLAIVAAGIAAAGVVVVRRRRGKPQRLGTRALGYAALGVFVWGALGLNSAEWTAAGVEFREVTLGGAIGRALVSSYLGALIWIVSLGAALGLLAPRLTMTALRAISRGLAYAWAERWPHRALTMLGRALAIAARMLVALFQRTRHAGEGGPVIGAPAPAVAGATGTIVYRPRIAPGAPHTDVVGIGGAPAPVEPPPAVEPEAVAPPEPEPAPPPDEVDEIDEVEAGTAVADRGGWQLPPIELLQEPKPSSDHQHDNAARAQLIVDTLASFGVDASVVEINEGPTVTQFGVEPGWEVRYKEVALKDADGKAVIGPDGRPARERVETGRTRVRVNKITVLQNDLALALAAPSLRVEAPVPGRAIVGIEVPNETAAVVTLRTVMESRSFRDVAARGKLAIALGKSVAGQPVVANLAKMPHLLIAGATGSGKSVCLNAIVTNLITNATPDEVRFIMVDPKRVELIPYSRLPHLAFSEVIVDMDKVVGTLQAVVAEMDARYRKFTELGVRNIETYNRHPRVLKKLPYWVLIIDELADLMMVAPFEVEKLLCRLAQLARATGIHLVVATQRPSVDVVTGLIKANFPTRIAFAVTSVTDSRTVLDRGGAEKLLGQGDMLYQPTDAGPRRVQGVYVSDAEVERLVEFWCDERFHDMCPEKADDLLEDALVAQNGGGDLDVEDDDPTLQAARDLATQHKRLSPSLLQRRLNVGHVKAERLIGALEEEGVVGPRLEGESREVLAAATASGGN